MKSVNLLIKGLLVTAALTACAPANQNGTVVADGNSQVIGGDVVKPGSRVIRSTVGLYDAKAGALCSGTLIAENIVLTAAHCVAGDPKALQVHFNNEMKKSTPEQIRKVDAGFVNTDYDPQRKENTADIALLRFRGGLPLGYGPAKRLKNSGALVEGITVRIAGYGLNRSWVIKSGAGTLRTTELVVADPHFSATEAMLKQSLKRGACSGDSGGPAYLDIGGELHLWGVLSRGDALPTRLTPDCFMLSVYTRADVYAKWIDDGMALLRAQ
ncbi:S1 family peptidase [Bdellovibrio sp. HCB288]|uniref:S1 family peptidase n=1 Tax=Bdellovibrio sp. HCB288 TaxID=3394355 RepID=UPI0039B4FD08